MQHLVCLPKGINERLMTMRMNLANGQYATVISAYAPTMTYPVDTKEEFYDCLSQKIIVIPLRDKLLLG